MNAERDRSDLSRIVGGLESSVGHIEDRLEHITRILEAADERSSRYRQSLQDSLTQINAKVDPIGTKVASLEMEVKAHEAVLKSYAERLNAIRSVGQVGRWLFHVVYIFGLGLLAMWNDNLKPVLQFWKW